MYAPKAAAQLNFFGQNRKLPVKIREFSNEKRNEEKLVKEEGNEHVSV